jgi:hypothetical protein
MPLDGCGGIGLAFTPYLAAPKGRQCFNSAQDSTSELLQR